MSNEQIISDVDYNDNTNQRTPCVLVLDGSTSMRDDGKIEQLNQGLKILKSEIVSDLQASTHVQIMIIRAGGHSEASIVQDWCDAGNLADSEIEANGATPLGIAMALALDKIEEQKQVLRDSGISYTRPWLFLISDGEPNDMGWQDVAARCRDAESAKKVIIFSIGVTGISQEGQDALKSFTNKHAYVLDGLKFAELFQFVSKSVSTASVATPGDQVQIPAPTMMISV